MEKLALMGQRAIIAATHTVSGLTLLLRNVVQYRAGELGQFALLGQHITLAAVDLLGIGAISPQHAIRKSLFASFCCLHYSKK